MPQSLDRNRPTRQATPPIAAALLAALALAPPSHAATLPLAIPDGTVTPGEVERFP